MGAVAHNWLVAAFEQAGIPVVVHSDYRALKWSKLMLNIVANATCAILNVLPERLVTMMKSSVWRSARCAKPAP